MRTFMLVSLLLLPILVHEAQGMRLVKGSLSATLQKLHERKGDQLSRNKGGSEELNLCEDSHCLKSGTNRKLMTKTSTSSSTTTAKNDRNDHGNKKPDSIPEGKSTTSTENPGGKEENFCVISSAMCERYPDTIDIAGMDYSPARRYSPIHN